MCKTNMLMKNLRALLGMLLFALLPGMLFAQEAAIRKAQKKMAANDFQGAIQLLEKKLDRHSPPLGPALLGECYRRAGRFEEAGEWYGKVGDWAAVPWPYLLNYARTLQRDGQYPEALAWYERYLTAFPQDQIALEQSRACRNIQALQQSGLGWWEVQALPINSPQREFSPALFDEDLVFCSDRGKSAGGQDQDAWTGEGFLDLFRSARKALDPNLCGAYTYGDPEPFESALSSRYHEASAHFTSGGDAVYFTSNALSSGKKRRKAGPLRLHIFYARRLARNRGWSDPVSLPINSDQYSVMHPCLSADGKRLYFASDMPGGMGGFDLYYVALERDTWGPPVNLGPVINSAGNEVFPSLASDGTLHFASDGWGGLGGMDLFRSRPLGEAWSRPVNPGAPLNSAADDFGLIWEGGGQCGYFSSDRPGGAGKDDLYAVRQIAHPLELRLRDEVTGADLTDGVLSANCRADSLAIGSGQGTWEIPHNACCEIQASAPGYQPAQLIRCTYNLSPGEPIQAEIALRPQPVYLLEGIVFDQATGLPLDGAVLQVYDLGSGREYAAYETNFSGRFEVQLEDGACYHLRISRKGFTPVEAEGPCLDVQAETQTYSYKLYLKKEKE